jgi:site-specific DNA-methyltransferase (adenine-specific)
LADKSVDHVICDPPFEEAAHTLQRRVKRGNGSGPATGDRMSIEPLPFPPITEDQRVEAARQFGRIAKRWVLIFCQIEASQKWVAAGAAAGLVYRRTCIWVKPDGMPQYSGDRPGMGYETIVALHAPGASTWNGGGQHGVFVVPKGDPDRSGHPTQKPDALMDKLVRLFTDKGDTIVDPFAGSASTLTAAERLGRNSIGWELDPRFHAIAMKRLNAAREELEMPCFGTP